MSIPVPPPAGKTNVSVQLDNWNDANVISIPGFSGTTFDKTADQLVNDEPNTFYKILNPDEVHYDLCFAQDDSFVGQNCDFEMIGSGDPFQLPTIAFVGGHPKKRTS